MLPAGSEARRAALIAWSVVATTASIGACVHASHPTSPSRADAEGALATGHTPQLGGREAPDTSLAGSAAHSGQAPDERDHPAGGSAPAGDAPGSPDRPSSAPGSGPDDPGREPASATPVSSRGRSKGSAAPATASPGGDEAGAACAGIDLDGDGRIDHLVPTGPRACKTGLRGACGDGVADCGGGPAGCMGPAPMPEVFDGVDNDCNGKVDDVPIESVHPRALVLAPRYAWTDAAPDIATVSAALAQAGIPFDEQPPGTDWEGQLERLDRYALAVVPGYLLGAAMGAASREAFEQFARRGGVVVVWKPVGTGDERRAWALAGLRASARRRDVLTIAFDGVRPPPVTDLDSPEERTLRINEHAAPDAIETYLLDPDPAAGTEVVAHGYGGAMAGAAITRRPLGKGAIYAIGHDLATFGAPRCYVNCFEPSGDVLRLFLEGALREGARGHVALKHTAPGEASSVLIVTHDVDAPDAMNDGPWGPPGALQVARLERAHGVRATFNVTTDYVAGYYNERTVRELCDLGGCPLGAHSVTHPDTFAKLPEGTCAETRATYGEPRTLCGEIRVSRELVGQVTGRPPRVWRSPYLALPTNLFSVLAKSGFDYDSGFGIGDLPYNLPVDLASVGFHQNRFRRSPLIEFPVACEDGQDVVQNGAHRRVEVQAGNRGWFTAAWRHVLLRNARNRSMTTVLLHPSRGRDLPPENVRVKVEALGTLLDDAAAAGADVLARPLEEVGDFWRARLDATLEAEYDAADGYTGSLTIGKTSAPGLTLEFGDVVHEFICPSCGEFRVHGKRVVLTAALTPGSKATFQAKVR
ncbi:MAG: polysaccharide deacetylase family protein [Myxococcales bacterium]|nr:polysaccharide deacetylase family protein [Myxococcales bacterium]